MDDILIVEIHSEEVRPTLLIEGVGRTSASSRCQDLLQLRTNKPEFKRIKSDFIVSAAQWNVTKTIGCTGGALPKQPIIFLKIHCAALTIKSDFILLNFGLFVPNCYKSWQRLEALVLPTPSIINFTVIEYKCNSISMYKIQGYVISSSRIFYYSILYVI